MQERGKGGSQYGLPAPEVTSPFAAAGMGAGADQVLLGIRDAASDQLQPPHQQQKPGSLEEQRRPMRGEGVDLDALALAPAPEATSEGEFPDEDAAVVLAGEEEAERGNGGVGVGNRWPREETLALLRIRSDMDAAFRDASLKGPLWEDVSRNLAEQGYKRSAKKCREKFENVHKYYKRTREGRAGRHDGKSYKFFTQLEALDGGGGASAGAAAAATIPAAAAGIGMVGSAGKIQPTPLNAIPLAVDAVAGGVSFSSNDSFSAEEDHAGEPRKRKSVGERDDGCEVAGVGVDSGGGGSRRRKMVAFFDGLMRQVVERQEAMQQKLLEMIEKREQDRMIREEAWRRQEMALLAREHEAVAQDRQIAAARDATIIAFLQKVTAQTVLINPTPIPPAVAPAYDPPVAAQPLSQIEPAPPPGGHQPQAQQQQQTVRVRSLLSLHGNHCHGNDEAAVRVRPGSPQQVAVVPSTEELQEAAGAGGGGMDPASSSRWPKSEVFELIKLRSEMESKCLQEAAGAKGAPLWEEIAAGMRRMGYSRSAKRCKEKWENINKYFKKVKDSSKKRTEDAKTCPYFHQLDALYRRKVLLSAAAAGGCLQADNNHSPLSSPSLLQLALPQQYSHQAEAEANSNGVDGGHMDNGGGGIMHPDGNGAPIEQARRRNGGADVSSDETSKEPEDAVRIRPAGRRQHAAMVDDVVDYDDKMEETESDSMEEEDEEKTDRMEYYRVEYHQRPAEGVVNGAAAAASNGAAGAGNSFTAMVQ